MAGTLQRIQDLFRKGDVLVLDGTDPETGELQKVIVYVTKLNALEKDEALKDGRAARARRMLAFDRDEDQQVTLEVLLKDMSDRDIVEDLLHRKAGEYLLKAEEEVRADKKWKERLEAIDRSAIAQDGAVSEQEQQLLVDLTMEFTQAVDKAQQKLLRTEKRDMDATPREELDKVYRVAFREMQGATAFYENRRQSEVWYALRECEVELDADDLPVPGTLKVGGLVCPTRAEVNNLPDEIVSEILRVLDGEMTSREAGNSGAPSASSGSSEQHGAEEDSKPSTPTET